MTQQRKDKTYTLDADLCDAFVTMASLADDGDLPREFRLMADAIKDQQPSIVWRRGLLVRWRTSANVYMLTDMAGVAVCVRSPHGSSSIGSTMSVDRHDREKNTLDARFWEVVE